MMIRLFIATICLVFSQHLLATASPNESLADSIEGVYKKTEKAVRWKERGRENETIEQILEVVPHKMDKIYFRLKYEDPFQSRFYGIRGIASRVSDGFLYKYSESPGETFVLKIYRRGQDVVLRWVDKVPTHYSDFPEFIFPYSKRRVIRYKNKIFESKEYKGALAEE
jgi:hypothetical protein